MVRIVREGDPRPAVAMVVATGSGSYASTALGALLEARLGRAGFPGVDSRANRDAFRVRSLVESPARAAEFVAAARAALAGRVTPGSPELALVVRRVAALRRRPLEAPIAQAVARCTGELGVLQSDASIDASTGEGVAQLETTRAAAYGAAQVAFAAVGGQALVESAAAAVHRGEAWPRGNAQEIAPPTDDQVGVYVSAERPAGSARLTVAVPTSHADAAAAASRKAGDADGPLVARLRALPVPFRLVEVRASARPRGGCLSRDPGDRAPCPVARRRRRRGARRDGGAPGARRRAREHGSPGSRPRRRGVAAWTGGPDGRAPGERSARGRRAGWPVVAQRARFGRREAGLRRRLGAPDSLGRRTRGSARIGRRPSERAPVFRGTRERYVVPVLRSIALERR